MADTLHDLNKSELERMLGVPIVMPCLPPEVVERCLKAQRCLGRMSIGQQLPTHFLLSICYEFEKLPVATPTKFGHLKEGHPLFFRVNDYEFAPCTFVSVQDPLTHTYRVELWGEQRPVAENQLREHHPGDAPADVSPLLLAKTTKTPAPVSDEAAVAPVVEEDNEANRDAELVAQRAQDHAERLKAAWPKGSAVDVALPGEGFFQGTIIGHGAGSTAGRMQVRPVAEKGKSFRWVSAEYLSKTNELLPV